MNKKKKKGKDLKKNIVVLGLGRSASARSRSPGKGRLPVKISAKGAEGSVDPSPRRRDETGWGKRLETKRKGSQNEEKHCGIDVMDEKVISLGRAGGGQDYLQIMNWQSKDETSIIGRRGRQAIRGDVKLLEEPKTGTHREERKS